MLKCVCMLQGVCVCVTCKGVCVCATVYVSVYLCVGVSVCGCVCDWMF